MKKKKEIKELKAHIVDLEWDYFKMATELKEELCRQQDAGRRIHAERNKLAQELAKAHHEQGEEADGWEMDFNACKRELHNALERLDEMREFRNKARAEVSGKDKTIAHMVKYIEDSVSIPYHEQMLEQVRTDARAKSDILREYAEANDFEVVELTLDELKNELESPPEVKRAINKLIADTIIGKLHR